jgi:ABC-type antimicrobial peptide transport system permease subunit
MSLGRERMMASLSVFFAVLAAFLASLGLYGMLSYAVAQRTRECGIRQALGASRLEIGASLMKQSLRVTLVGLAGGSFWATLAAAKASSYGLRPDPFVFAAAGILLLCVALAAALGPAIRAAHVAPARALQAE